MKRMLCVGRIQNNVDFGFRTIQVQTEANDQVVERTIHIDTDMDKRDLKMITSFTLDRIMIQLGAKCGR